MLKPQGINIYVTILLLFAASTVFAQTKIVSLGLYTGITSTYTWDEGINADPRYNPQYDLKMSPIGLMYGVDYTGFGFLLTPGLISTGQNFNVVNTVGGQEGIRKINLQYFQVPVALKIHLIDLSFLKTSFVIGASGAYLVKGEETITHNAAKLYFPPIVHPILPDNYTVAYDGVLSPSQNKFEIVSQKDFNPFQLFAFVGLQSDWYLSEDWKVSFDFRVNYVALDNRSPQYLDKLESYETIYDIPGKRRDIIGNFTIGFARYLEIEEKEQNRKNQGKKGTKRSSSKKYPWPGPRKSRPKS
jgi:hypothetical protein